MRTQFERKLGFLDFAALHRVSALHGSGVGLPLDEVDTAYANAMRIEFKSGTKPFKGRRNTLTERQMQHRQRLKAFVRHK